MAQGHKSNHRTQERMPQMGKTGAVHPSKLPMPKAPKGGKGKGC